MKRPALQNKQVVVFRMAFQVRKVFGTFEKRAPGACFSKVPKLFGAISGATTAFISSQCRGSKPSNFAVLLVFLILELFYYIFAHNTVITDLAPQVAEANRGGPGKIKINEIC